MHAYRHENGTAHGPEPSDALDTLNRIYAGEYAAWRASLVRNVANDPTGDLEHVAEDGGFIHADGDGVAAWVGTDGCYFIELSDGTYRVIVGREEKATSDIETIAAFTFRATRGL